jgi:alpha-tubulin suppressor-like RCC1 family protein
MTGRNAAPAAWDGIEETNLWQLHKFGGALHGMRFRHVISGSTSAHYCLIAEDGGLFTFGRNEKGQLGLGHTRNVYTPVRVPNLPPVVAAATGRNHTLVVTATGAVFGAGDTSKGQLGINRSTDTPVCSFHAVPLSAEAQAVACGNDFSVLLDKNGNDLGGWEDGCVCCVFIALSGVHDLFLSHTHTHP